ncbi:MAG: heparinase II/III family protein [Gemmatimonadota bacterium]|nr:heparinase II/III family protein [Gemmatimonadota bacterium]
MWQINLSGLGSVAWAVALHGVQSALIDTWFLRFHILVFLLILPAVLLAATRSACPGPRTLYKSADIENARRNVVRYDWAKGIVEGWERDVALAMRQDRGFFEALIPELTPGTHYGQNCPNCVGKLSLMGGGRFNWTIERPDEISCSVCGTVYPNARYPETGVLECPRMGQRFTYYQTPEEVADPENRAKHALKWLGERPTMTSFTGHIRDCKVGWATGQALTLAKLYAVSGEARYAERVVWILDRFARVYPNYLYHSYDGSVADLPPAEVAANMGGEELAGGPAGGRFPPGAVRHAYGLHQFETYSTLNNGFWGAGRLRVHGKGSDAGPLFSLLVAYDLIGDASYPDGRRVLDDVVERRILDDLILAGCADMEHWNSLSNKGTAVFVLSAGVGMLFGQPDRVRRAQDGFRRMLDERYHHDGFYAECPSYSAHNLSNVHELADLLHGYSDPHGYLPDEGERIDSLDIFSSGRFHDSLVSLVRSLAPGNRMPVIGDTQYIATADLLSLEMLAARLGGAYAGLLEQVQGAKLSERGREYALWYLPPDLMADAAELPLRSEWFPGWHVGVLRGGRGASDTALFLNGNEHQWTVQTGHRHQDVLSLSLYAHGEEMVSDRGYFSGSDQRLPDGRSGQRWMKSTLSHNLVVVDEEDQRRSECGSNLELFGLAPGIEVVQASGVNVYPQCDVYQRVCVLVDAPEDRKYLVDVFRVRGGRTHQYGFQCNGTLAGGVPDLSTYESETLSEVWAEWMESPRGVSPEKSATFSWEHRGVNLDLMVLSTSQRLVVADAPGWRIFTPEELKQPSIGHILAENRAADGQMSISSQFAALIAPYISGNSPAVSARLIENDPESGAVAIEVQLAGRTDYIISTMDQERRRYGPVSLAGRFGFASVDGQGRAVRAYLLNGTELTCGDLSISLPAASTTLSVRSVEERTFHLAEPVPDPDRVAGTYLLTGTTPQTGFEIESATENAITVRDYPAIPTKTVTILNSRWASPGS